MKLTWKLRQSPTPQSKTTVAETSNGNKKHKATGGMTQVKSKKLKNDEGNATDPDDNRSSKDNEMDEYERLHEAKSQEQDGEVIIVLLASILAY